MDGPMEIPMPGGRSEVFRARGCEAERLPEEHTLPRWVVLIGEGRATRTAKEVPRERNLGAVTEPVRMVSGFGRQPPPRSPARDGFLTPIRSPAAPETSTSTGASRKIGGKTACGSMRPGPTALRYLCGRNGCHPPGRHSRDGAESRDTPPAFRPNADPPACRLNPRTACPKSALWEASHPPPETDANRCHTDANHCHSAPMADQSARDALSSLPKP